MGQMYLCCVFVFVAAQKPVALHVLTFTLRSNVT